MKKYKINNTYYDAKNLCAQLTNISYTLNNMSFSDLDANDKSMLKQLIKHYNKIYNSEKVSYNDFKERNLGAYNSSELSSLIKLIEKIIEELENE